MRAARLIKMVLLLQSRASMTAAELARELEVSERTVSRDALALSEAGVPVYAERGRGGGYRLIGGYRTGLTGLGRDEAEALFLSGVPGALRDLGLADVASAARMKVAAALIPSLRDAPLTVAQRFHLDAPGWFQEPATPACLGVVASGVWGDRVVRAVYGPGSGRDVERSERGAGQGVERSGRGSGRGLESSGQGSGQGLEPSRPGSARDLEPYGLVLKAGVWYLCARAGDRFRTYRVERFTSVELLTDRFERDPSFELPGYWDAQGERFARSLLREEAVVRLSPEGLRGLARVMDPVAVREAPTGVPDAAGWVTVTVRVESEEVAFAQLLGLGAEAEVLAPAGLRRRFAEEAGRLGGLYGEV